MLHCLRIQSDCLSQNLSSSSLHIFQVFTTSADAQVLGYVVFCSRYSQFYFVPHQHPHSVCNTHTNSFHLHQILNGPHHPNQTTPHQHANRHERQQHHDYPSHSPRAGLPIRHGRAPPRYGSVTAWYWPSTADLPSRGRSRPR